MTRIERRKKNNANRIPIIVGVGLFMLVVLLLLSFGKKDEADLEAVSSSSSVIPNEVDFLAPDLTLKNVDGKTESLEDYRGKVVLVNNWATWCPPCTAEIPTLQEFYKTHQGEGFVIVGIEAGDPQPEVLSFVKKAGITYPIWIDLTNASMRAFGSNGLPNSFVIGRGGTVRLAWVGEINRAMLEKYVTPIIAEN
jgi:peroxiredoxin